MLLKANFSQEIAGGSATNGARAATAIARGRVERDEESVRGFPPASRFNLLNLDHCHEFWSVQPKLTVI
jgi:hypothetical protein